MKKYSFLFTVRLMALLIFLLFFVGCFYSKAEYQGEIVWDKTFGGSENDQGNCIIETSDGGYAITGVTESMGNGKQDLWVLKLDRDGELQWDKTFGGSENDQGNCIIETSDGGYAITGVTESTGNGKQDLWVLKIDRDGELQWDKTFGGSENDQGIGLLQKKENNHLVIGGWTESYGSIFADYWFLELNQKGGLIWDKIYGGDDVDKLHSLTIDNYSNLLGLGYTYSKGAGGKDAWLIKLDSEGNNIWDKTFGGTQDDELFQIISDKEAYFLIGYTYSKGAGGKDAWLIKLDYNGEIQWEQVYGEKNSEFAESLVLLNNNNIAFCGQKIRYCPKCSSGGFSYYWVAQLDTNQEIKWQKIFLESSNSRPHKIIETKSSNILVMGNTINASDGKLDICLVKME